MRTGRAIILTAFVAVCLTGCSARPEPLSVQMVRSEIARCPEATYLDGREGALKWNYTIGLELLSFLDVYEAYGDTSILSYVDAWYDAIVDSTGAVLGGYKKEKFNIDHVCPARTLLRLRKYCPREKYDRAVENIFSQLQEQPRTEAGAFWHKEIYPYQVWLDGLYMGEPFYAEYAAETGKSELFDDITLQFKVAWEKTFDPDTGLPRHAWDESRLMFWCEPETGQSAHSWGRATGWYAMALVDVLKVFPEDHPERRALLDILGQLLSTLPKYADPETGMWYQVLDSPGREGNYIEATCSAMFTYAYLLSQRMGWLPEGTGIEPRELYEKLVKAFIVNNEDGTISLTRCCAVAGLGGKENRSGTFKYYIGEKIIDNDPKGIGPFIWASLEYERL